MRIALLQHTPSAGPAALDRWLDGHQVSWHRLYAGAPLPGLDEFDLLMLLDGALSVHDERHHLWMSAEKRLIHRALLARKRVFGSGLGALLLAEALGARIQHADTDVQVGWWQLEKCASSRQSPLGRMLPPRLLALHWQRETCSLPHGAIALYGSPVAELQGFVWQERASVCCVSWSATAPAWTSACSRTWPNRGAPVSRTSPPFVTARRTPPRPTPRCFACSITSRVLMPT